MTERKALITVTSVLYVALFLTAFLIAPHACHSGLVIYFWAGLVVMTTLLVSPFALARKASVAKRALASCGLVVLGAIVWTAGMFAANVPIICRLF